MGLELCFIVNAVFTLWGGLYRRIVERQRVLSRNAEALDLILSGENYETIAVHKLHGTIRWGIRVRNTFWYSARGVGAVVCTTIYVASVSFAHVELPADANWLVWLERAFAYLAPALVVLMAASSLVYEHVAKRRLSQIEDATGEHIEDYSAIELEAGDLFDGN